MRIGTFPLCVMALSGLLLAGCGDEQRPSSTPVVDRTVVAKVDVEVAAQQTDTAAPTSVPAATDTLQATSGYPPPTPALGRIAFSSSRDGNCEIYVIDADGSSLTQLTNSPGDNRRPRWSPDGSQISFGSDRDGNQEVYVMDADGSNQTNITNDPDYDINHYCPAKATRCSSTLPETETMTYS